jgi:hypothetical protein
MQKAVDRPTLRFKEDRLLVFSYGHVLNEKDFERKYENLSQSLSPVQIPEGISKAGYCLEKLPFLRQRRYPRG